MVSCPRCGSEDVERITAGLGTLGCAAYAVSGLFLIIGIFFWPLLILAVIMFIVAVLLGLAKGVSMFSKRSRTAQKWSWQCKKCKKVFVKELEERS